MMKFKITTEQDIREAAAIERRRQNEEERKARIFNAKQRILGLDYPALERQIAEKNKQKQIDAEKERRYLAEEERRMELIKCKENQLEEERKKRDAEINFYRAKFQRRENRREYDLNDPFAYRNAQPARIADDDPRLGISSAQIFSGEDLLNEERRKNQRNQQRAWLEQQIHERRQAEENKLKADRLLQEALVARDQRAIELDSSERNNRKKMQEAIREYNRNLALQQQQRKAVEKQQEEEDNLAEIYNVLTSDMLTENPDVANSCLGPGKKVAYLYRGMTPEELEQFRREQKIQAEEKAKMKAEEVAKDGKWDQFTRNITRSLILKELEVDKRAKAEVAELHRQNFLLATEQKARKEELEKFTAASDEFYAQFNKSTR
ncbi:unnamed protein product [Hermetia illucens]|uniref:RIB43A-like with coiled-coils protein 2 n=1 Tax=Hermetia illucens TaxID=343691 RepID=A0A7R8V1Z3_HERIL|nr:RIB43A-like with coiled-coils protein 2 [Hermetia illucens]CAD7091253.1 unnamed protein product [Hermetia illucens]